MSDQIEKVVTGYEAQGPLPIAGTDEPGIASFSSDDFLVNSQGKVEALTKWGIAHVLTYKGVNDVARMYDITTSFGKQLPKVGDVGLVLSDQVNPSMDDTDCQIGKIVLLTAIQSDAYRPIVYYGETLGSIAGPRGIQGKVGPMGAIQLICDRTQGAGHMGIDYFLDGSTIQDTQIGKLCLMVKDTSNYHCGDVVRITSESGIYNNTREYDGDTIGNIRGPQGTSVKAVYHDPEKDVVIQGNTLGYGWRLVEGIGAKPLITNDIVVVIESSDAPQYMLPASVYPGTMFVISNTEKDDDGNTYGVSFTTPIVKSPQFNLGLFNLSVPVVEQDNFIVWKIIESNYGEPFTGAMGFCTNPDYSTYYGKLFTILGVSKIPSEVGPEAGDELPDGVNPGDILVTTSNVGADFKGPSQELAIGTVNTVPNDETGAAGTATATMTETDRLHKKLNLGIPVGPQGKQGIDGKQGPQGIPGPAGVANVNAKGAYDPTVAYVQNDLVYFDTQYTNEVLGGSYIRTENLPNETGLTPKDNPTAWGLFVAEGAPGKDGAIGPVGPVGPAGPAGTNGANGVFNALLGSVRKQPALGDNEITWNYVYVQPNSKGGDTLVAVLTEELSFSYGAVGTFTFPKGGIINVVNVAGTYASVQIDDALADNFVKGTIADSPQYVNITNPSTATEGNFTDAQFATLQASRENKIIFDNEIYVLNDQGHDAGYNVYTHVGHNSQDRFVIKCITVNLNNKSWVLTEQSFGNNIVNLGNGNASSGNLTQAEWDILHENVDAVIELGDDVYRYAYSDSQSTSGGTLMRDVFVCVLPYDLTPGGVTITQTSTKFVVCSGTGTGQYPYSWSRQGIASPAKKYLHNLTASNMYGDIVYAQVVNTRKEKYIIFDDTIGSIPATGIIVEGVVPNNVIYTVVGLYWDESNAAAKIRYINASTKLIGTKSILSLTIVDNVMEL